MDRVKLILEELVGKKRFSGREMYSKISEILKSQESTSQLLKSIQEKIGEQNYEYVITGLLRNVFLIELVNDDISSTKMEVRWVLKESRGKKQESFDQSDPRFCTFEDCVQIFLELLKELRTSVEKQDVRNLLELYQRYNLLSYEVPLDYTDSPFIKKSLSHIHCLRNIQWIWDYKYQKTLKLREILLNPEKNSEYRLFSSILKDKIKVETYLTDRVQTGKHKTNREKRWEVHPESVHFSFRRNCLEIERKLIEQLSHFEGFPKDLFSKLKSEGMVTEGPIYRCPVTLNPFSFEEFKKEIESRIHGKSNFQVGHLNPLKLVTEDPTSGHTPENISWFSADGNRIQGNLSLKEIRQLLGQIYRNYRSAGISI
jgi:hypothetical protein